MNRDIQTKELINIELFRGIDNSKFLIVMKNRIYNYDKSRPREKLRLTGCYLYK